MLQGCQYTRSIFLSKWRIPKSPIPNRVGKYKIFIMKKNSIFGLVFCFCLLLFSCTNEENITNDSTDKISIRDGESEDSEQIFAVLDAANEKLSGLSNEEYREIADPLREELNEQGELTSLEVVPLEDLFFLYEGILNYDHMNLNVEEYTMTEEDVTSGNDQMETFEFTFEVEVQEGETGQILDLVNFNNLYSTLQATIADVKNSAIIPNIISTDLDLVSLAPNLATISYTIVTAKYPPVPQVYYPIPMGEVRGAINLGWCPSNNGNVDAADFFRGHANTYISTQSPTQAYQVIITMNTYSAWSKLKLFRSTNYYTYEVPLIWKDVVNSCVGDNSNSTNNNNIWNSWYNKTSSLINIPLNHLKNNVDARYVFITTTLDSYQKQWWHGPVYTPNQYWHEGNLQFGITI